VRVIASDHFIAAAAMGEYSQLVTEDPGRHEQGIFLSQHVGGEALELDDGGIVLIDVIPYFGGGHGLTHRGGGLGDGVAAQVNPRHSGTR